jgi:hypothetical protein
MAGSGDHSSRLDRAPTSSLRTRVLSAPGPIGPRPRVSSAGGVRHPMAAMAMVIAHTGLRR